MKHTIYHVKYDEKAREMFKDTSPDIDRTFVTFEYPRKGYEIVKTEEVNARFEFISSYAMRADYYYYNKETRENVRFTHQYNRETYGPTWNYKDADEFEKEYNSRVNHVWQHGNEPIPADVFEVFKKFAPEAINGL